MTCCVPKKLQSSKNVFLEISDGSIYDYSEFSDDSVLCYQCLQKLGKLVKFEKETAEIKQQISEIC